jgi:PhnB protein
MRSVLRHAELEIDGTTLMFGERKPDWPLLPQLT